MNVLNLIFVIFTLVLTTRGLSDKYIQDDDYKLELVQVMFRHTDRTPNKRETYPNDPYKGFNYEPYGHGQLTNVGRRRAYHLGEVLKKRYGEFIDEYNPSEVYAYSTILGRTKMTMQLVLSALYPLTSILIPINQVPPNSDDFFAMFICNEYEKLFKEVQQLPEVRKTLAEYKDFFNYLSKNTGFNVSLGYSVLIYATLQTQMNYGFPLPEWCSKSDYDKLEETLGLLYDLYVYNDSLKKLSVGPAIRKLISNIQKRDSKKLYLYSIHDVNVFFLLRAHGVQSKITITNGMTVAFEKLRGKDNEIYIRILFYPGHGNEFQILKLTNCDEFCPLSKYLKIIDPILPTDKDLECLTASDRRNIEESVDVE